LVVKKAPQEQILWCPADAAFIDQFGISLGFCPQTENLARSSRQLRELSADYDILRYVLLRCFKVVSFLDAISSLDRYLFRFNQIIPQRPCFSKQFWNFFCFPYPVSKDSLRHNILLQNPR